MAGNYKELIVWQKSMDLVVDVYKLVKLLPTEELYALSSQIRRAVVSIPSNIAEGYNRKSTKEYLNYLHFARGSNSELQTQLIICVRLGYLKEETVKKVMELSDEVAKIINAIINKLG
ncbi:MAG: four helix bundle protein [Ruminococcus sp.]|nr:four helix bundle protein [Ruminococcus sp.]